MRKLKFRAWDAGEKKMLDWVDLWEWTLEIAFEDQNHQCVFMQFTGLKDKNGKEIFEGDIVHVVNGSEGLQACEVAWKEEEFCWALKRQGSFGKGWWLYQFSHVCDECDDRAEVIGNVHENGDLLK